MNVSSKEFKQNTYKYLKPGEYVITNHDVATLKVVITVATGNVATKEKEEVATPLEEDTSDICKFHDCGFGVYHNGYCIKHDK